MISAAALTAARLAATGLARAQTGAPRDHGKIDHAAIGMAENPAVQGYQAAMDAMMAAMAAPDTGAADGDFVNGVIPPHQAAIVIARVVLAQRQDRESRTLAEAVIAAQETGIAQMRAWLAAHRN